MFRAQAEDCRALAARIAQAGLDKEEGEDIASPVMNNDAQDTRLS